MVRVFISYSRQDRQVVDRVVARLLEAGHSYWMFDIDQGIAGNWRYQVREAIEGSDYVLVMLSAASARSIYMHEELMFALEMGKPIIPIQFERGVLRSFMPSLPASLEGIDLSSDFEGGTLQLLRRLETRDEVPTPGPPPTSSAPTPTPTPTPPVPPVIHYSTPDVRLPEGGGAASEPTAAPEEEPKSSIRRRRLVEDLIAFEEEEEGGEAEEEEEDTERGARAGSGPGGRAGGSGGRGSGGGTHRHKPSWKTRSHKGKNVELPIEFAVGANMFADVELPPRPLRQAEPAPRYANVVLLQAKGRSLLEAAAPLERGATFRVRLDIGALSRLSVVRNAVPIPEKKLPANIWLDVLVSSTDFEVGRTARQLGRANVAQGRFFLPGDGGPALTEARQKFLYFLLRAPERNRKQARARINYYYRNHLVQSQLLVARVGGSASRYEVTTDYTLSESLTELERLPKRRQVSILTNDNGNGTHQFVVRAENTDGSLLNEPCTFELNADGIGRVVRNLRDKMKSEEIAPIQRQRRKEQLKNDLRSLAPLGWQLYADVGLSEHLFDLGPVLRNREKRNLVLQVTRPKTSRFAFPWGLIYDIPLESEHEWSFCALVDEWDGHSPLVAGDEKQCPKGKHAPNTLCPFGFWGYRFAIEQLTGTDKPVRTIPAPPAFEMVMAETQYEVSTQLLKNHASNLRGLLTHSFPNASLVEGASVDDIENELCKDTPLVYFYCHGERPAPGSSDTVLGVGRQQRITPSDFIGWVKTWWDDGDGIKVWDKVRPLIFVNACHSMEVNPDSLVTYLDAFIGTGHAAGLIGTEVKVSQPLAMEAAQEFFSYFLAGESAGQSLQKVRMGFLASGNLFGLVYTPYCWSDLKLARG